MFHGLTTILLDIEFQDLPALKVSLKVVIYVYRPYPYGSSGIDDVPRLKRKELADEADQLIYAMYHIAGKAALNSSAVYVQVKMQLLNVTQRP